jgi:phosphoglycerate dehydrogenase-like enzyme
LSTHRLLLLGRYGAERREPLERLLQVPWQSEVWTSAESDASLRGRLAAADAVVVGADALLSGRVLPNLDAAACLRLLQIPFAGHDWLKPGMLPPGAAACTVHEHASGIAEYVLAALLEWEIGLRRMDADFRAGRWTYAGSSASGIQHGEVRGKTLGLLGYGHIGQGVAQRAKAFDMRVIAAASRARGEKPDALAWLGGPESRERLYAESDYLVLACALNDGTRGLIDRAALERMKRSAVLVNVARGPVAVEADLFDALKRRVIAGAVLDVWYRSPSEKEPAPAPSRFPFHELDNVVMTPHCAGWTAGQEERRLRAIAANLDRFSRGEPLHNVVVQAARTG